MYIYVYGCKTANATHLLITENSFNCLSIIKYLTQNKIPFSAKNFF